MIETRNVYVQLIELCQQQLAAGRWPVGERFPSERELAAEHGLSRATANKVLAKLVSEGWLEIRRGLGAFVAERPTLFSELRQMDSFTDFARANGLEPSTEVIAFETNAEVTDAIRADLDVSARERIIYIQRLRRLNGVTVIHEERWLPGKRYPRLNAKDLAGSFYALCRERFGLRVDREEATVRAALAPKESGMGNTPTLRVEGAGYDAQEQPLWRQRLHYHGECFELHHNAENVASYPRLCLRMAHDFMTQFSR